MLNSTDKAHWIAQYRQELFDRDRRSSMNAARKEGKLETAKKMLADGIPTAQIVKWTGLSTEEIAQL